MNLDYFDALVIARTKLADALDDPAAKGIKESVVDKYKEQAHFVYELLQNADDAKAKHARFKLYHDRLIFAHDGARHFSISDPATEDEDTEKGILSDVNSILSIGNSAKIGQNKIGKFGVGFKSVFQYTSTPYIYDPQIRFKIERFFVPCLLEEDHKERRTEETLFDIPFNQEMDTVDSAFEDISNRLSSLINPILFLTNLENIYFEYDDTKGEYRKKVDAKYSFDKTTAELIVLTKKQGEHCEERKLYLFSRNDEGNGRYAVGFFLDEDGDIIPVEEYAYCFFPTRENTGLKFIIHAPFLLTDSRESIKEGNKHNQKMISLLADLAADSLVYLRDIGIKECVYFALY